MNLYFLLEGKRTEPKVYPKWINHQFPSLTRVNRIDDVTADSYFLLAAKGYPLILQLMEQSLTDICNHYIKNKIMIEHFFICLDADEDGYEERRYIVTEQINKIKKDKPDISLYMPNIHIIIQNCCIETWFLGNRKMLKRKPQSRKLLNFKKFYDVSIKDPENMNCYDGKDYSFSNKAAFHEAYLKEMFSEQNLTYSKEKPGITVNKDYFDSLVHRCFQTNDLTSLKHLLTIWNSIVI